jgi:hypothetical protein
MTMVLGQYTPRTARLQPGWHPKKSNEPAALSHWIIGLSDHRLKEGLTSEILRFIYTGPTADPKSQIELGSVVRI